MPKVFLTKFLSNPDGSTRAEYYDYAGNLIGKSPEPKVDPVEVELKDTTSTKKQKSTFGFMKEGSDGN